MFWSRTSATQLAHNNSLTFSLFHFLFLSFSERNNSSTGARDVQLILLERKEEWASEQKKERRKRREERKEREAQVICTLGSVYKSTFAKL